MPRFSGTRLAPFASSLRRNQRGSQVWRFMFSRTYNYRRLNDILPPSVIRKLLIGTRSSEAHLRRLGILR
jgi:hypothetical protein